MRRIIPFLLALAVVALGGVALAAPGNNSTSSPFESLYTSADTAPLDPETGASITLGVEFSPTVDGYVNGVEFLRADGASRVLLYDADTHSVLASTRHLQGASGSWASGWFKPVRVQAGHAYTAALFVKAGSYYAKDNGWDSGRTVRHISADALAGHYGYGSSPTFPTGLWENEEYMVSPVLVADLSASAEPTPTASPTPTPTATDTATPTPTASPTSSSTPSPTPTATSTPTASSSPTATSSPTAQPTVTSGWPGPDNTGIPAGTSLDPYTGPCSITGSGTVTIDRKDVRAACVALVVRDKSSITITNSRLPRVENTDWQRYVGSVDISYSDIASPTWYDGVVWGSNYVLDHVDITGGQHSIHAIDNVTVTNSWLHDQYNPSGGSAHTNAFLSNGGGDYTIRHNTLHCDSILNNTDGGCTGDLTLLGDFMPIHDVTIDGNLFKANSSSISYCLRSGDAPGKPYPVASNIDVVNNVFERGANGKCGVYGWAIDYNPSNDTGSSWSNNTWDDGRVVTSQ